MGVYYISNIFLYTKRRGKSCSEKSTQENIRVQQRNVPFFPAEGKHEKQACLDNNTNHKGMRVFFCIDVDIR